MNPTRVIPAAPSRVGLENFTEGRDYQIQGGWFRLIGVNDSILLFTPARLDGSGVPLQIVKAELAAVMARLEIEAACREKGDHCDLPGCGNCHPENFE